MSASSPKRYAIVGLGGRHEMYRDACTGTHREDAKLVGLCDVNAGRLALSRERARRTGGREVPGFAETDFERMVAETKPDAVIVCSRDDTHDHYITRAMELGCDVITEKPMTIDAARCQRILDTQRRTGRSVRVCFNYRYSPPRVQLKDLLMSGVIGAVLNVDFHWLLDISHGADYFRRWHRNKRHSGGLLVHKATHHFDLVNWWLSSEPVTVQATGDRRFYLPRTADRPGLSDRGERCHGCPTADRCSFVLDMAANESLKALYLDCETHDGYYRDRCVFSDDIDIEDTTALAVDYANGVKLSYSLTAYAPWEGYTISLNGTLGRIEHRCEETVYVNADGNVPGALKKERTWTRIYPHRQPAYDVDVWTADGGHGGADPIMLGYLFDPTGQPEDKYLRAADHRAGACSILTGIAANHSMREGHPVRIDELVTGLDRPDWPAMPDDDADLSIPRKA